MRKMCQPSARCDKMRKFPQGLKHLWPKQQQRQQTGYCPNHFVPHPISKPSFPFLSASVSLPVFPSLSTPLSPAISPLVSLSLLLSLLFFNVPLFFYSSLNLYSCLNPAPYKAPLPCNRFHQHFLLAKEEYMVIKGSVAKRDRERLHPAADVEQEKKEENGVGKDRKRKTAEKGQEGKWKNRERDKEGLNGDRKWKAGAWGSQWFRSHSPVLHGSTPSEWKWD